MNSDGHEFDDSHVRQRNERCVQRMRSAIEQFKSGVQGLAYLISNIEGHLRDKDFGRDFSGDWIGEVWDSWGVLEEAHAVAVVAGEEISDSKERARIYGENIDAYASHIEHAILTLESLLGNPDWAS